MRHSREAGSIPLDRFLDYSSFTLRMLATLLVWFVTVRTYDGASFEHLDLSRRLRDIKKGLEYFRVPCYDATMDLEGDRRNVAIAVRNEDQVSICKPWVTTFTCRDG